MVKGVAFFVDLMEENAATSDQSMPTSARGTIKKVQCAVRGELMKFPGARRLTCAKRLTEATAFLKAFGANEKEFCMCLYVSGNELPEAVDCMKMDKSVTAPEGSNVLAEYLLNEHPYRVQIKKYSGPSIQSLGAPENCVGRMQTPRQ